MTPETVQRVDDWVEVREALLARVASLDPKQAKKERNINIWLSYAHLLVALRRATITLIRMLVDDAAAGDRRYAEEVPASEHKGERRREGLLSPYCFTWMGMNYLTKICDTAFLDGIEELQSYFGVTFQDNPLMAEETLGGEDARVEHDARGTRWDFPPRRRRFFGGLDTETVKFVHGVLRKARGGHEENTRQEGLIAACDAAVVMEGAAGRDEAVHRTVVNSADEISRSRDAGGKALLLVGFDDHSTGVLTRDYAETPEAAGEKASPTSTAQRTRRAKETDLLLHQFAGRAETRRRSATLSHTFGRWSSLTAQMREVRGKINFRFDQRQRVRALAMQRRVFAALGRHSARNRLTREAARQMLNGRRAVTARQVLEAFASNLERGRALGFSADALRVRVSVSADRRALSNAITALKRKRNRSRDLTRRAEKMRIDVLTRRPSIGAFRAWATAAGLVGRLRNRLGRAERALLENVLAAWTLFVRHSAAKRARRQKRTDQRAKRARVRAWDAEVLDVAFFDWANATAATKFRRLRLLAHAFHGWRAAASQGVSRG